MSGRKRLPKKVFPMDAASQRPTHVRRRDDLMLARDAGVANLASDGGYPGHRPPPNYDDDHGSPNIISAR